jgi:hypothetical protein
MTPKEYDLKTIEDITNVLTESNIDNFLVDFKMWLSMRIEFKKIKEAEGVVKFDNTQFRWIDDGKHEADITLKVNIKTKEEDEKK